MRMWVAAQASDDLNCFSEDEWEVVRLDHFRIIFKDREDPEQFHMYREDEVVCLESSAPIVQVLL